MKSDEFKRELAYEMTMLTVRKMVENGLISKEEYVEIESIFKEKYTPILGTLLSDISLT